MATQELNPDQLNSIAVTDIYFNFYTTPDSTGTVGNSYSKTGTLPREAASGESILLVQASTRWCIAGINSIGTTTFSISERCVVNTSIMSSSWTAIYYRSNT